jgi:hypothetical protein
MKNIGFAKIGKSVKFKTNKYSPIGGDNEASCMIRSLANNNPDKNFYIVGRSDFATLSENEKTELFPYDNVYDVWQGVGLTISNEYYQHIITYFKEKNIELDFTVMMIGQLGSVTIPDKIKKVKESDDDKPASVLDMTKWYVTPIATWLNEAKPRYVEIVNDPRYTIKQSRDLFHHPEKSLGQYDFEYVTNAIKSYEDQSREIRNVKSVYAGMETAFCYDYDYTETAKVNRSTDFMVVLNEGKPSRYNMLKEWVLNNFDDVEIYGKWEEETATKDARFKGSKHIGEIQRKFQDVKYTFIIPIAKGWVTSKYIEMIHAGVIPFLHPTYDEQNHTGIPDFFRPQTPQELIERIAILNSGQSKYEDAILKLRKLILKKEYYNGEFINDTVFKSIDPNYVKVDVNLFDKKEPSRGIEDFFA